MKPTVLMLCISLPLGACSRTPPIVLNHYLPQTETAITVTQVVTCDAKDQVVSAASVDTTTSFSANTREAKQIDLSGYGSSLADTGLTFEFYDDGRLKSVNVTSLGKGGEIVKSAIGLVTTLAARGGPRPSLRSDADVCKKIKAWGKGEPITLTYKGTIRDWTGGSRQAIPADALSYARYEELKQAVGYICPVVTPPVAGDQSPMVEPKGTEARIPLRQPANVKLDIYVGQSQDCSNANAATNPQIFDDTILVSEAGRDYEVPIPRPAPFGKQTFALTLTESGALTKLQYDTEPGTAAALDAAKEAAAAAIQTDAETTARATSEMGKIKALSALAKCKADPTQCG